MPRYDYRCKECNNVIEVDEKMNDDIKAHSCEKCNGTMFRQLSTPFFKINGYNYKNGYSKTEANNEK